MKSLTHAINNKYRSMGFKIGTGARVWGTIDSHAICVSIGDYTTIGGESFIATHCPIKGHSLERLSVHIDKDVWVGFRSSIAPGTTIGRRTIVGMSSVVTGKLQSDSIYAGNPVRKIRTRNPVETVRTRLYTIQGLSCVPHQPPKWDVTKEDIVDIFDDLLDSLPIDRFRFLLDGKFCSKIIDGGVDSPATIEEFILMLDAMYRGKI